MNACLGEIVIPNSQETVPMFFFPFYQSLLGILYRFLAIQTIRDVSYITKYKIQQSNYIRNNITPPFLFYSFFLSHSSLLFPILPTCAGIFKLLRSPEIDS
jgi:hypothetical protein